MKRRPWGLIIIVWLHVLAPVGNILLSTHYSGNTLSRYLYLLFQPYNFHRLILFVVLPIICGALIYLCKRWSYLLYIVLISFPFFSNLYFWNLSRNNEIIFVLCLAYLANIFVVGYFMKGAVRKIYFDHRIRWWETKPRFHTDIDAEIYKNDQLIKAKVVNLSVSGLFFQTDDVFQVDDQLSMSFKYKGQAIRVNGAVVYSRKGENAGFGVKFTEVSESKKALLALIQELKNSGAIIESRLPGPEDSFITWLRTTLQSNSLLKKF